MLLSTGEQITAAKLSILLNRMGYKAISLTGWQAGIITNDIHRNAKIEQICTERIKKEFEKMHMDTRYLEPSYDNDTPMSVNIINKATGEHTTYNI